MPYPGIQTRPFLVVFLGTGLQTFNARKVRGPIPPEHAQDGTP